MAARARLAELEAGFTIEKAKMEAMKARLFARLREWRMASLRRAMPTTPQAHFLEWRSASGVGMARGATPSTAHALSDAETAAALAETSRGRPHPLKRFVSSRSDGPMVAGAFKPRIIRKSGFVAERRLPRTRRSLVGGRRRSATRAICGAAPGLESPGYRRVIAPR